MTQDIRTLCRHHSCRLSVHYERKCKCASSVNGQHGEPGWTQQDAMRTCLKEWWENGIYQKHSRSLRNKNSSASTYTVKEKLSIIFPLKGSIFSLYEHGPTHAQAQITIMLPQFHRDISYFKIDSEQHAKDARVQCECVVSLFMCTTQSFSCVA